ncbi:MAG TPA: M48 family metalloprotease [Candidatus Omnitrophota bacterium]|jgi:predicted Zn-dependent protease|nr:M48 family metalloprotease [Candidatus Omnitrophota bacterium]HQB94858.1 M48 family metalloprotease [Candidatus Omnitrophota bacterium]
MKKIVTILLLTSFLGGCATTARRGTDEEAGYAASRSSEECAVGAEIHKEILSRFYPYTDPKVVQYVNEIGKNLARYAGRKDLQYRFTILYDEKIYATSAPGGYVYLTTGMLNFLGNEAELAAILAHEIGRLQYRDPRFTKSDDVFNAATQTGAQIAPMFGPIGSLASLGLLLLQAYVDSTQQTPEELLVESDQRAMDYLLAGGYDPQALMDTLEYFLRADNKAALLFYDYYQSRPITEKRVGMIQKEFRKLPLGDRKLETRPLEYQEVTRGIREIYKTSR